MNGAATGDATAAGIEAGIAVAELASRADRAAFLDLPGRLMADDPAWVEPLRFERRQHISPANPVFTHAEGAFFLARRGGRPVGRISATIDRLSPPVDGRTLGMFGMFACEDDPAVAAALFGAAERWLAARGAGVVRGPYSLSPNQESGLLVAGFDTRPAILMPHDPPYAGALVEGAGYRRAQDLLAYRLNVAGGLADGPRRFAAARSGDIVVRSLDTRRYAEEIATVAALFNDAWSENWGFVPLTEPEIDAMRRELKMVLDPELVKIAERAGEPVAFIVLLPDVNEAIRDLGGRMLPVGWAKLLWRLKTGRIRSGRVPLMGVRRDVAATTAGKMLPFRLIYALEDRVLARRLHDLEFSWLLEDNRPVRRFVEALGSTVAKTYRIYEKRL